MFERTEEEGEEGEDVEEEGVGGHVKSDDERTDKEFKPVFLKGLFRSVLLSQFLDVQLLMSLYPTFSNFF